MTRAGLAKLIEEKTGISKEIVSKVLDTLGEAITEGLMNEIEEFSTPRIMIPNLGYFQLKEDKRTRAGKKLEFKASAFVKKGYLARI